MAPRMRMVALRTHSTWYPASPEASHPLTIKMDQLDRAAHHEPGPKKAEGEAEKAYRRVVEQF